MEDIELTIKCLQANNDDLCSGLKETQITFSTNGETATIFIDKIMYVFGKDELEQILKLLKAKVETNCNISFLRKQNFHLQEENKKLKQKLDAND